MNERRIARIQELIKARVAEVVTQELADPDLGMVTITRVTVDRELMSCKVYWSCLGGEGARKKSAAVLNKARSVVRREIAAVLSTRTVPEVQFRFDESIAGAMRIEGILKQLKDQREGSAPAPDGEGGGEGPGPDKPHAGDAAGGPSPDDGQGDSDGIT